MGFESPLNIPVSPSNVLREYTGNTTWNKPTNPSFKGIWVFAAGGGGSGGGGQSGSANRACGGGAGGGAAFVRLWIPSNSLLPSESVVVGLGGVGVVSVSGSSGGDSLFGIHVLAKGGGGGARGLNTSGTAIGGAGGSALLCIPIASGYSISGGAGGNGRRSAPTSASSGLLLVGIPGGGGGAGTNDAILSGASGANGGGIYANETLVAGGSGGIGAGSNGTSGSNNVNLDVVFLGLVT